MRVTEAGEWRTGMHVVAHVAGRRLRGTFVITAITLDTDGTIRWLDAYGPIENVRLGGRCAHRSFYPDRCTIRKERAAG